MLGALVFVGGASRQSGVVSPFVVVTATGVPPVDGNWLIPPFVPSVVAKAIDVPSGDQAGWVSVWPASTSSLSPVPVEPIVQIWLWDEKAICEPSGDHVGLFAAVRPLITSVVAVAPLAVAVFSTVPPSTYAIFVPSGEKAGSVAVPDDVRWLVAPPTAGTVKTLPTLM